MKKIINTIINAFLHLVAVSAVLWVSLPVAQWYLNTRPLWGVDFFYTVTFVTSIKNNLVLPHALWFYNWYGGWPLVNYFPVLHYYFILPFTFFYNVVTSVQLWMVISTGIFLAGVYALTVRLSGLVSLGFLIGAAAAYSVGVYGGLTWGGSLPSFASQAFYPWVYYLAVCFLQSSNKKYLYMAAFLTGLSILGHPLVAIGYIFPTVFLLFFSYTSDKISLISKKKLISLSLYLFVTVCVGFPVIYQSSGGISNLFKQNINSTTSTVTVPEKINQDVVKFIQAQPFRIYSDNHTLLFLLLALGLGLFILRMIIFSKRIAAIKQVLPFFLISIYYVVYIWIFAYGISIVHGGWYRLFWSISVWLGALIAILFKNSLGEVLSKIGRNKILKATALVIFSVIILVPGIFIWKYFNQNFFDRLIARSEYSSAFPGVINLHSVNPRELIPDFMQEDDYQYRLYDSDATINIWFSSLYKRPLARGYLDPPLKKVDERNFIFLTDAALSEDNGSPQLCTSFGFSEDLAYNNALFFIDWQAIKYLGASLSDAGHALPPAAVISSANIKNDKQIELFEVYKKRQKEILRFLEFKDEITSPITQIVSLPVVAIYASESGYDTIMRNFAHMNLNSRSVIPLRMGRSLDNITGEQLSGFGALILYEYDYSLNQKGKISRLLSDYVKKGGKIFIDTGSEVRESQNSEPLEILPLMKTTRDSLGSTWEFQTDSSDLTSGIDFTLFSPALFDQAQWNVSYADSPEDLKEKAEPNLTIKEKTVVASIRQGQGKVIWSGLNLPYHIIRYNNPVEVEFFQRILEDLIAGSETLRNTSGINRVTSEKVVINKPQGKGILFKEEFYPGWQATSLVNGHKQRLAIYHAGPTYPGYMYLVLPTKNIDEVEIVYKGSLKGILVLLVSFFGIIWSIDSIIGLHLITKMFNKIFHVIRKPFGKWWEKDAIE